MSAFRASDRITPILPAPIVSIIAPLSPVARTCWLALLAGLALVSCSDGRVDERAPAVVTAAGDVCPAPDCPEGTVRRVFEDGSSACEVPDCESSVDCAPGQECDHDGYCTDPPECDDSNDCPGGSVCSGGECVGFPCTDDDQCLSGTCQDGACVDNTPCDSDADCPGGWTCYEGQVGDVNICVPASCETSDDCPGFLPCIDGACTEPVLPCGPDCPTGACDGSACAPCTTDADCSNGATCEYGLCVGGACSDDADCPWGQTCEDGACDLPGPDLQPPGGPCSHDADCDHGLVCAEGVCEAPGPGEPDGGVIEPPLDAGLPAPDGGVIEPPLVDAGLPAPDGGVIEPPLLDAGLFPADASVLPDPGECEDCHDSRALHGSRAMFAEMHAAAGPAPAAAKPLSGLLTVWVIPPGAPLNWTTPNTLFRSMMASRTAADAAIKAGQAKLAHPIGHVHVQMSCQDADGKRLDIPLTGQTGGGSEWQVGLDGLGILLRDWPGKLDHMDAGNRADVIRDVFLRRAARRIYGMRFKIDDRMCKHLHGYYTWYDKSQAWKHYGGQFRPRRLEGSGCSAFGVSFLEVGGFLPRPSMTRDWARELRMDVERIANFPNGGAYPYGSNLIAWFNAPPLVLIKWAKGVAVPAIRGPLVPIQSNTLDAWWDPRFQSVPLTLYDPELMGNWIAAIHRNLRAGGNDPTWKIDNTETAEVIISDWSCDNRAALPGYHDPEDDLRK
jgi:hypothetical protein